MEAEIRPQPTDDEREAILTALREFDDDDRPQGAARWPGSPVDGDDG